MLILGKCTQEPSFTVVLVRELTFPTSEHVENRCMTSGDFIFPTDLIRPRISTYVLFTGRHSTCIFLLILTQESLGQKLEPNSLVFLWNYEGKIILKFLIFEPEFETWKLITCHQCFELTTG